MNKSASELSPHSEDQVGQSSNTAIIELSADQFVLNMVNDETWEERSQSSKDYKKWLRNAMSDLEGDQCQRISDFLLPRDGQHDNIGEIHMYQRTLFAARLAFSNQLRNTEYTVSTDDAESLIILFKAVKQRLALEQLYSDVCDGAIATVKSRIDHNAPRSYRNDSPSMITS